MAENAEGITRLPQVDHFAPDRQEYVAAKADPDASSKLRQLFEKIKEMALGVKNRLNERVRSLFVQTGGRRPAQEQIESLKTIEGSVEDETSLKHQVEKVGLNVKELLKSYKQDESLIPEPDTSSGKVIKYLLREVPNIDEVSSTSSPYVYEILSRAIKGQIERPLEALPEAELISMYLYDTSLFDKVTSALRQAALDTGNYTAEGLTRFNELRENPLAGIPPADGEPPGEIPPELRRGHREYEDPADEEAARLAPYEYPYLLVNFTEAEDRKLLRAIFVKKNFENYISDLHNEFSAQGLTGKDLEIAISQNFSVRVANLIGKLFQRIDEGRPDAPWEEEEQKGSMFATIRSQAEAIFTQLNSLSYKTFDEDSIVNRMKFYSYALEQYDRVVPTPSYIKAELEKDSAYTEPELITEPFMKDIPVNFHDYIMSVKNYAEDQRKLRMYGHNVFYLLLGPEPQQGYYRQLENYAETLLPAHYIDVLFRQPDSELLLKASRLDDKFAELELANYNWIHQSEMNTPDPIKKRLRRTTTVESFLKKLAPNLDNDSERWRILRAALMSVGDSYGISLKAIEHAARGFAPRRATKGEPDHVSYDLKDHKLFMPFYPHAHYNLRYAFDDMLMGNLLFLPVEGKNLPELFKNWDHRKLMDYMHQSMRDFEQGQDPKNADKDMLKLVDWVNPSKVGSIYTRGYWRYYHAYEAFLPEHETRPNVAKAWKGVENLGIDIMKDFVDYRIENLNPDFYKAAGADQRSELVTHLMKRYYRSAAGVVPGDAEINSVFNELERHGESGLPAAYKEFYYKVLARGVKQRIPTKFLRFEKNSEVYGRQRAWDLVMRKTIDPETGGSMAAEPGTTGDTRFKDAVYDIAVCEAELREEITKQLKARYLEKKGQGEKLPDIDVSDIGDEYELTEEKLRRYLDRIYPEEGDQVQANRSRKERAVAVFRETINFTETYQEQVGDGRVAYLDNFAHRYKIGRVPFALATDELERSLLAHGSLGPRAHARALMDIANTKGTVEKVFTEYFELMKNISFSGTKDFSPLLNELKKVQRIMEIDVGPETTYKFMHHMSALTIQFFLRDKISRNIYAQALGITTLRGANSLAGEFASAGKVFTPIWEWDLKDADLFIRKMTDLRLLPVESKEVTESAHYEKRPVELTIPFTGGRKIHLWDKDVMVSSAIGEWTSEKLRKDYNITMKHILWEQIFLKWGPIILAYIIGKMVWDSFKESMGDSNQRGGMR